MGLKVSASSHARSRYERPNPLCTTRRRIKGGGDVEQHEERRTQKDKNVVADTAEVMGRSMPPHDQVRARSEPATEAGMPSCIGSDMSIIGKIDCNGPAQVFGRIEGELRASQLLISDGAQVQGSIIAQDVTVCGRVKGISVPSESNCRTAVRSRVTSFIAHCRSTRTLYSKDRHGELKIQRSAVGRRQRLAGCGYAELGPGSLFAAR